VIRAGAVVGVERDGVIGARWSGKRMWVKRGHAVANSRFIGI